MIVKRIPSNIIRAKVMALLQRNEKKSAARILWPWVAQNEQSDKIWHELQNNEFLAIMGHASASKTFTCVQYFLLDWWTAPHETALLITSDTIASMEKRVWADLKNLFTKTKIRMPGELIDSKRCIRHSSVDTKNAIYGIAAESKDAQSKIQGIHTKNVRVLIDEADNKLSNSIWGALANLMTSGAIKCCALANPDNRFSEFGLHAEPIDGWSSISPESDTEWISKKNFKVLRLDGLNSPNIVRKKDDFPFLLTNEALEKLRNMHGPHSLEWWKYVRAWYPPEDTTSVVFPLDLIEKIKATKIVWYSSIQKFSALDPAFEGGDDAVQCFGDFGRLASDPSKTAIVFNKFIKIKRKDMDKELHLDFADQVIQNCKDNGISPFFFAMDASGGNGAFMASYIKSNWSKEILPIEFGGACTDKKILQEDLKPANERFDRFVTELWFAGREFCRNGLVQVNDMPNELQTQLNARLYSLKGKGISSIESKKEMKARGLKSPDYADTFNIGVHLLRIRSGMKKPTVNENKQSTHDPMKRFASKAFSFRQNYGIKDPEKQ